MTSGRVQMILGNLEETLLRLIHDHRITHDEYRRATNLLAASITTGEGSLLWDIFLEAETTRTDTIGSRGSVAAIEGPFYLPNAPRLEVPHVLPQRPDEPGNVLVLCGRVTSLEGTPLPGAELDMWQADARGQYSNIHPGIPDWNLRGRFHCSPEGTFEVRTIVPPPYEIPKEGPTGVVLRALGRHFFRPAHVHVKVKHPDYVELTSQLYFAGGEHLTTDVANAVEESLIVQLIRRAEPAELAARSLSNPYFEAQYHFRLVPRKSAGFRGSA